MEKQEEKILKNLKDVFVISNVGYNYSIGSFENECMCIEKINDKWYIYDVSGGEKTHLIIFSTLLEAAKMMIKRIADSFKQEEEMLAQFDKLCHEK